MLNNSKLLFFKRQGDALLLITLTWGVYFVLLFSRMLYIQDDGFYTGHPHVWSDWSLHLSMATIFAHKSPDTWFAYHPIYAEGKFTYGFLTNLISGLLMRCGAPVTTSFVVPSILYCLSLCYGIYALFFHFFKSKWIAYLTMSAFFLSSGLGCLDFFKEFSVDNLLNPPREYSSLRQLNWMTGNFISGMLLPQRTFLLGMCLSVWSLFLFIKGVEQLNSGEPLCRKKMISAALLVGILPICHMHSFIVLFFVTGLLCFSLRRKWKDLLWYVIPAGVLSTSLYFTFIYGGIQSDGFFQWFPFWTSSGFMEWSHFWLYAWGPVLPLAGLGFLIILFRSKLHSFFFLGFFLVFIMANFILVQPMKWDNSKIFFWCYLPFSALSVYMLALLWSSRLLVLRLISCVLFFAMTFTGFLECIKLQRVDENSHRLTMTHEMKLAEWALSNTDPLAVFVTEPAHNHPITVWGGRSLLLGHPAWAYNFGFLYKERQKDIRKIFQGTAETKELIRKYKVSYVYIGYRELRKQGANLLFFKNHFPIAKQLRGTYIFDVRNK